MPRQSREQCQYRRPDRSRCSRSARPGERWCGSHPGGSPKHRPPELTAEQRAAGRRTQGERHRAKAPTGPVNGLKELTVPPKDLAALAALLGVVVARLVDAGADAPDGHAIAAVAGVQVKALEAALVAGEVAEILERARRQGRLK
jgi:hypothetical protein